MLHFQPKKCHIAMRTLVSQLGRMGQSSPSVFHKRLKSHEVGFPYVIEIVVKDLNSTVAKRGSVFIGLMTPDGAIWFRYQRTVLMR